MRQTDMIKYGFKACQLWRISLQLLILKNEPGFENTSLLLNNINDNLRLCCWYCGSIFSIFSASSEKHGLNTQRAGLNYFFAVSVQPSIFYSVIT